MFMIPYGIVALLSVLAFWQRYRTRTNPSLPPGPKPLPILGNFFDFPPKGVPPFQHWLKHKDKYGGISSVTAMGQTLIILHDRQAAYDLLQMQSAKTSGRPSTEFGSRLCGFEKLLFCQQYDADFRLTRKLLYQQLGTIAAVSRFNDHQEIEMQTFLRLLLDEPQNLFQHIRSLVGANVLRMTYGYSADPKRPDPLVDLGERMLSNLSISFNPGAWLVDYIPILKYLPDGFPGAAFRDTAQQCKRTFNALVNAPYLFVCQQMNKGTYRTSYVSNLLEKCREGEEESDSSRYHEDAIKLSAADLYIGASDTTISTLNSFIFIITMFPEVQYKAQAEIDLVVGTDRLPRFEDRDKLQYVNAIVKELYRWSPIALMGFPHVSEEDIDYNGYRIPKGAYLLPAIWWFCHDPEVYSEPETFDPERYLEPRNEPDPKITIFGYGRRICPGRHFADSSIFLAVAETLAAFKINKATDKQEVEEASIQIGPGMANENRLVNFHYEIVPRSAKQAELLQRINITELGKISDASLLEDTILDDGDK